MTLNYSQLGLFKKQVIVKLAISAIACGFGFGARRIAWQQRSPAPECPVPNALSRLPSPECSIPNAQPPNAQSLPGGYS